MNLAKLSEALAAMTPQNAFSIYDALAPQLEAANDIRPTRADESLAVDVDSDTGSVTVDLDPGGEEPDDDSGPKQTGHYANLALELALSEQARIASDLLDGIAADDASRGEWLAQYASGLDLLGLKIKKGSKVTAVDGQSTVQHPVLLEAVTRYAANALGELLPSGGPVKIAMFGDETEETAKQAVALEKDFNYYLMNTASEFRPDTDQMLFKQGFCGLGIKKVYNCPRRRRPVSESVDPADFIVSNAATDLTNASRITHRILMRPSILKRMQLLGVYRDTSLPNVAPDFNAASEAQAAIAGVRNRAERPEDEDHEIYECYCELDLPGYEHKEDGQPTGLALPYRVTIDKHSSEILDLRRNWEEGDEEYAAKKFFVLFPFINAFGIYGLGLLHLLGNSTRALTAAWRVMLDLAMFNSFPGFIYAKQAGRQMHNEFRIPPGGGLGFETGGQPIDNVVKPLPYKEPSQAVMALIASITEATERLGGTAESKIGEGRADAPVGTTVALIEQATKIEGAVHKRAHQAQAEEFQLLKERFRDDPEAFWRYNKRPTTPWKRQQFIDALDNCTLVPVSDPNTPSNLHRLMKASALLQLATTNPTIVSVPGAVARVLAMMNIDDPESLLLPPAPPQAPQLDLNKAADLHIKQQTLELQRQKAASEAQQSAAELHSKNNIAVLQLARETAIHPESAAQTQAILTNTAASNLDQ